MGYLLDKPSRRGTTVEDNIKALMSWADRATDSLNHALNNINTTNFTADLTQRISSIEGLETRITDLENKQGGDE